MVLRWNLGRLITGRVWIQKQPIGVYGLEVGQRVRRLMTKISDPVSSHSCKVTVVGAGMVGMACAACCAIQGYAHELAIVDASKEKSMGEMIDMQHGSLYMPGCTIIADSDMKVSADSRVCVVTAGARQKPGEDRLSLVGRNIEIFRKIIPELVRYSPKATLLIVANPVDILTYVSWKISGLPKNRVLGTGTSLDTARFKFLVSKKLGVSVRNTHGWILGEHGDSSVPVWSTLSAAGVLLRDAYPKMGQPGDPDNWEEISKQVVSSAYDIIKLKGFTSWGIGLTTSKLCERLINNSKEIDCVSTFVKGHHGIEEDVCLSLPCLLGENGVLAIVNLRLADSEKKKLVESAKRVHAVQKEFFK